MDGCRLVKPLLRLYEKQLKAVVNRGVVPRHVGLVMDGNRRWARQMGMENPSLGHRYGAEHIDVVLGWCREVGIDHVTIYLASVDNLRKRDPAEVSYLLDVIDDLASRRLTQPGGAWRVHLAGRIDTLRPQTARALKLAEETTADRETAGHLSLAVGYDGRMEIVDAVRSMLDGESRLGTGLSELADRVTDNLIASHLHGAGRPDPDLIIRTSGEQRLSGFLLWQSAGSDLHFCETYWPGFRRVDFLRALRDYGRNRARNDGMKR